MSEKKLEAINCAVCGISFVPKDKRRKTCSRSCGGKLGNTKLARKKARQTMLERYGDPNFNNRKKAKRTVQEKYGDQYINPSQVPEIKNKIVETYSKRHGGMGMASESASVKALETTKAKYGVEDDDSITNVFQIEEVKNKIRGTHNDNWGGIGFASEELAERSKKTFKERYGEDIYDSPYKNSLITKAFIDKYGVTAPILIPKIKDKIVKTNLKKYGGMGGQSSVIQEKMNYNIEKFKALYESDLYTIVEIEEIMNLSKDTIRRYAKELNIELSQPNRLNETWQLFIKNKTGLEFEYEGQIYGDLRKADLYHNELKLAIEINPTITHTTQPSVFYGKRVPVKYHQERAISAEENGWHLIQVFDWDKPEDIIKLIKSVANIDYQNIYARKCEAMEIDIKTAMEFANKNHRQGSMAIGNIAYGLFYKDQLVQIQTYAKERFVKSVNGNYELIRMCSKDGIRVVGGASKLMSAFVNSEYKPTRIKTFVDYSKGQGKTYEYMGMKCVGLANLNAYYANIDTGEAYKVTAITSKFKSEYDKLGQTQQEYMNSKRFFRINDAGNKIFEWVRCK